MTAVHGLTRVSCSAFLRIGGKDGALILHRASKQNRIIMRPLGGSLRAARRTTLSNLQKKFGAHGFEDDLNLRFLAPHEQIGGIDAWFRGRHGREASADRVLFRQLHADLRILTRAECARLRPTFAYHSAHSGATTRETAVIKLTHYLVEVYDVSVPPDIMAKLAAAATGDIRSRRLHFTLPEDIKTQAGPGGYVSSLALTLIQSSR